MKDWQGILLGLFCGLLATGAILVVTRSPRGEAISLAPPPTPAPVVVHVSGAVNNPGVYQLPASSRVLDAITEAGGLRDDAITEMVNLAASVSDGIKIHIPVKGEPTQAADSRSPVIQKGDSPADTLININTASIDDLETLPGIGPTKAQNIIDYRMDHGSFEQIDDILSVPGIGEGIFETIKDRITVE